MTQKFFYFHKMKELRYINHSSFHCLSDLIITTPHTCYSNQNKSYHYQMNFFFRPFRLKEASPLGQWISIYVNGKVIPHQTIPMYLILQLF